MESFYLIFLLAILLGAGGRSQEPAESDEDAADDNSCISRLANPCFKGLMPTLKDHLENRDPGTDICVVYEDALQCASDIIDTSCRAQDGQLNFDAWMSGLTAVRRDLCGAHRSILNEFLADVCFSREDFFECVEYKTGVSQVTDLLTVILNNTECHRVSMALATCNVRSSPSHSTCYHSQDIVNYVVHTFFANTQCGYTNKTQTSNSSSTTPTTRSAPLLTILLLAFLHVRSFPVRYFL